MTTISPFDIINHEEYNSKWSEKLKVPKEFYSRQSIRTYENEPVSRQTVAIIGS
jgi:hypothetical protein